MSDLSELVERVVRLVARGGAERPIVGITGPPGAGKSTVAEQVAAAVTARGFAAARVPMDGFHLSDHELVRLGRRDRKGAIDTFDADGYAATLRRARSTLDRIVYAPDFDRSLELPVAGSIPVLPAHRVVITEGNYLLAPLAAWRQVRDLLDEVWYCELPGPERVRRLVARHERFGKLPDEARAWVETVDERNARAIAASRQDADLVIDVLGLGLPPGRD